MAKKFEYTIKGHVYVLVDFDGTITTDANDMFGEYHLQPNVQEVMFRLYNTGQVHFGLWTCRNPNQLSKAEQFLMNKGLYHLFEHINGDFVAVSEKYNNINPRKSSADVYFDDRAMLGEEVDWLKFEKYIMQCLEDMKEE